MANSVKRLNPRLCMATVNERVGSSPTRSVMFDKCKTLGCKIIYFVTRK